MIIHQLLEGFDTVVDYSWTHQSKAVSSGVFKIGMMKYRVLIDECTVATDEEIQQYGGDFINTVSGIEGGSKFLDVQFGAALDDGSRDKWTFDNTGTGKQWVVLSTVIAMIKEHMSKFGVAPIYFSADDEGRQNVYTRLLRRFLPSWRVEQSECGTKFVAVPN